jgi:hypothetical protein
VLLKSSNRSARTRACRVHTRVNARRVFAKVRTRHASVRALRLQPLTPFWVRARPGIVLHLGHQSRLDRIRFNVPGDPVPFTLVAHPMIVRFAPPELLSSASQQFVCFPRRKSFERLQQFARGYQGEQQYVDVIRHDGKRSELVVPEIRSLKERVNHTFRDGFLLEERWPGASFVQVPIHPNEGFAGSDLVRRREPRTWQAAVQMPGDKKPATLRVAVGKPALRVHATTSAISLENISVAHALVRAVFALMRTQPFGKTPGVHTSVNAARRSACAT